MGLPAIQSRRQRLVTLIALTTSVALTTVACGSGANPATSSATAPASAGTASTAPAYPVSIQNCGTTLTVDRAPTRAVSNDVNTTEDLLALGLAPQMAGDFGVDSSAAAGIPAQYRAAYGQVRHVSSDYFTLEPLVALKPDLLFAGWNYGLEVGSSTLTPAGLKKYGIATLALTESCAHVQKDETAVSIDGTYQDLTNLGAIFGVQATAASLVAQMKAEVADVQSKVSSAAPVSVFVYDSGTSAPFTAPGLALPNALVQLAGGRNVFADLKQSWTSVSWERVVAANPACILINDYDTPTWQAKEKFLKSFRLTKDLPAVKNNCFFHLRYDQLTPSPLNADAVTAIAKWLHPTAFS